MDILFKQLLNPLKSLSETPTTIPTTITNPPLLDSTAINIKNKLVELANVISPPISSAIIYGFHINSNNSDPDGCITYIADAVGKTPAHMDYINDIFDYGSWSQNEFFMPRPCMLKQNIDEERCTVDYYLDPNDYTKKEDGTASDLATMESAIKYPGNAMMEWGRDGYKIWISIVPDENDVSSGCIYISNTKINDNYYAYPFVVPEANPADDEMYLDHFYTAIYNSSLTACVNSYITPDFKFRSIPYRPLINSSISLETLLPGNSNKIPYENIVKDFDEDDTDTYFQDHYIPVINIWGQEISNNNIVYTGPNKSTLQYSNYFCETFSDIQMINILLILLGKSLNTQEVFGKGNIRGYYDRGNNKYGVLYSGALYNDIAGDPVYDMNIKGLFYGKYDNEYTAVKVFGMENWWGNQSCVYAGHIIADYDEYNKIHYIKQTFNTLDGSTANWYSYDDCSGYINTNIIIKNNDGYVKNSLLSSNGFIIPSYNNNSTNSTYYCDYYILSIQSEHYPIAMHGGDCMMGFRCGAFYNSIYDDSIGWNTNIRLTYRDMIKIYD